MDEQSLKAAFAAFLVETGSAEEAAFRLFPGPQDTGKACQVANEWIYDPFVIVEAEKLKRTNPQTKGIPTKEEMIVEMWKFTKDADMSSKDRVTAARLVADMLNYIPKAQDDLSESRKMPSAPIYKIIYE